jgi:Meiotic cell cortex C-terminal pleckstrin homology
MPLGLYQYSVVVSTAQREMKFTAPTKERHDIWFNVRKCIYLCPLVLIVVCRLSITSSLDPPSHQYLGAVLLSAPPPQTILGCRHQRLPIVKRQPRARVANAVGEALTRARPVRTGTPPLVPSAVSLASQPTQPPSASAPEHPLQNTCVGMESLAAPAVPTTKCLIRWDTTRTSTSKSTRMIPRPRASKAWRMCGLAVMDFMMLVLFRVADTITITITIMITRCPRCHHSPVPSQAQQGAAAVHQLLNNIHPGRRLLLAGLYVPENPTAARVLVKTAEEAACSPGPRGRAKSLHPYDRRFR